jgi:4-hydroxy-tetrahydrodipicolinate reductase
MGTPLRVSLYGAGLVGGNVAKVLSGRKGIRVEGPFDRAERDRALRGGADVVVIATTSFLADIADDVRAAVESGSNVITTAEEAAYPWANDEALATELDELARRHGVTILGAGLNPGYAFDALVVTACGYAWSVDALRVVRIVDLSGFGETVLRRIGIGYTPAAFEQGRRDGTITGHIGFPQSMQVVARKLGVTIDRIDRTIDPIFARERIAIPALTVDSGCSAGFEQRYTAIADGAPWFEAVFTGHIDLREIEKAPRDEIHVEGPTPLHITVDPGFNPQIGSAGVVANSIRRVAEARPGWVTVADLPPASPG